MFQYEKLLQDNSIEEKELPDAIREAITRLQNLDYQLDDEEEDAEIKELTDKIKALDLKLVDLITDWADDETDEDLPEEKVKENILITYHNNELRKIKLAQLKAAGYKFPATSKWIEKIGPFCLEKALFNDYATLTRVQ